MSASLSSAAGGPAPGAIVIGAGPAGLMAAEMLAKAGARVDVYDAMPSVGRKFLLAGRGGLNLTHSEPLAAFIRRYDPASQAAVGAWLADFTPDALRGWAHRLGVQTFIGSSGRVFPREMKAAPMLRAWLARLREAGVRFHMRHKWLGWSAGENGALHFASPQGEVHATAGAVVLALGGASWARLGSDGAWVPVLRQRGVRVADLAPANCGFDADWTPHFRERFAGMPVKAVAAADGAQEWRRGEFVITETGVEGGLVYALSARLRDEIARRGHALLRLDLAPGLSAEHVHAEVSRPRGARSLSSHLQSRLNLKGVKMGLLRECLPAADFNDAHRLSLAIKALPVKLLRPRPIDEAISSAGGVRLDGLDRGLELRGLPGVFCAGEMLDWDAPTGGYLLTACLASGVVAARGAAALLGLQFQST